MTRNVVIITNMQIKIIVCALGIVMPTDYLMGGDADPQLQQATDAVYAEMTTSTGSAYLAARDRLLSMDKTTVKTYLESKRKATSDVLQGLWLDAVLLRMQNSQRLDKALEKAFAQATKDNSAMKQNPASGPDPPSPSEAGGVLVKELGDDALPFATEMLLKDLTRSWEGWKRLVPIHILSQYGRQWRYSAVKIHGVPLAEYTDIKDPRAAEVLLWAVEHGDDRPNPEMAYSTHLADHASQAANAAIALEQFASPELLHRIDAVRNRIASNKTQLLLERTSRITRGTLRSLEKQAARAATQPVTTAPATTK